MTKFLVLFVFIFSTLALAQGDPETSPDFTYNIQKHPSLDKHVSSVLHDMDHFFGDRELYQVSIPTGLTNKKSALETVDRVYSGALGHTVVFVKTGVVPSHSGVLAKTVKILDGYLTHQKQSNGLVVAIYVKTKNWEIAQGIFEDLEVKKVSKSTKEETSYSIISSAYAADDPNCDPEVIGSKELHQLATAGIDSASQASPMQHLTACSLNAVKGVWNGSGGAVVDLAKAAGDLITSPVETGKKYWESVNKLWDATEHFFADFQNEARKLYSAFDSLEPLVKTKIACEVIGTIGGSVLLTYLTAGVAAGGAGRAIIAQINKAIEATLKLPKYAPVRKTLATRKAAISEMDRAVGKDLFDIKRGTPASASIKNNKIIEELDKLPVTVHSSTRKAGLNNQEIQKLYQQVYDHPVASLSMVDNYSKASPGMGYCFGRATTAHLKAINSGLDKNSIRKVWALGDLKTGGTEWRYHVTTIVRASDGKWHAIDPIFGRTMPVENWYKEMKKFDSKGDMRIFSTDAKRFGPSSPQYDRRHLANSDYEGYFDDLMSSFRKEAKELAAARRLAKE